MFVITKMAVSLSTSEENIVDNSYRQTNTGRGSTEGNEETKDEDEPYLSPQSCVEEELASFRAKWQIELKTQPLKDETPFKERKIENKINQLTKEEADENISRKLFMKGIEMEKAGKLYEAIQFYRKAVQIVPDIEFKLDYRNKHINEKSGNSEEAAVYEETNNDPEDDVNDEFMEEGELLSRIQRKVFKVGYMCFPKFEQNATHISALPFEILLFILRWIVSTDLDLRSLEIFGSVCRGFYLCARDPEIWRVSCLRIWGVNCGSNPGSYVTWRNMFIERPRLNFNGCYISKTTYIRHGENSFQDQFYRPWHLVAYYRYLRFFPDGIVLMLTSPDEPAQCVGQMKTKTPRPPVMVGYYRLKDDKVTLVVQRQDTSKAVQSTFKRQTRRREADNSEQKFHMELEIKDHKNKRHVKLVWSHYSIFTKTKYGHESTCNFDLKTNRFPPLKFSRVKSFTSESDQALF